MKRKTYAYILGASLLLLINALYLLIQPFPKSILLRTLCDDGGWSNLVVNLLFFIFQYAVYIWFILRVYKNKVDAVSLDIAKIIFSLLAVQLSADIVMSISNEYLPQAFYAVCAVSLLVTTTVSINIILHEVLHEEKHKIFDNRIAKISALIISALLLLEIGFCISSAHLTDYYTSKYIASSELLATKCINAEFASELSLGAFQSLVELLLFSTICILSEIPPRKENAIKSLGTLLIRLLLALSIVAVADYAKIIVVPKYSIGGYYYENSVGHYSAGTDGFNLDNKNFILKRYSSSINDSKDVLNITKCEVHYDNKLQYKFLCGDNYPAFYYGENYILINNTAAVFHGEEIAWVNEDGFQHKNIRDVNSLGGNDSIIDICEYMIQIGSWDFFEYSSQYLLKYDPEFIKPYIDRYASGDFTEEELKYNAEIKPSYIQQAAESCFD